MNIVPAVGERALIVAQTGAGKTAFATWLMQYLPATKIDDKFKSLPDSVIVEKWADVVKHLRDIHQKYTRIVFRPPVVWKSDRRVRRACAHGARHAR